PAWTSFGMDADELIRRTYARMGRKAPSQRHLLNADRGIQSEMAEVLRQDLDLATAPELLADYAQQRVHDLHDSIRFVADFIGDAQHVDHVTEMDVVRLIHSSDPFKTIVQLR